MRFILDRRQCPTRLLHRQTQTQHKRNAKRNAKQNGPSTHLSHATPSRFPSFLYQLACPMFCLDFAYACRHAPEQMSQAGGGTRVP